MCRVPVIWRIGGVGLTYLLLSWYLLSAVAAEPRGTWQVRAALPSSRTEVAAAELGGKIYVIGGYGKTGKLVEEYDPEKDRWRARASLPQALHHTGAAALNGKLYVIGGYVSGVGAVDTVYEYDPAADRWTAKKPMPTARGALAVGVIGGKIFAAGGVGVDRRNTHANEAYDPIQDRWTKHAPMPTTPCNSRSHQRQPRPQHRRSGRI